MIEKKNDEYNDVSMVCSLKKVWRVIQINNRNFLFQKIETKMKPIREQIIKLWDLNERTLRCMCSPLENNQNFWWYKYILKEMADFVSDKSNWAFWLALPQIWHLYRWYVCRFGDKVEIFINPKLTLRWYWKVWQEACLSEPWVEKLVLRNEAVTVRYIWIDWVLKDIKLAWIYARIAQHEQDHLDGILLVDK